MSRKPAAPDGLRFLLLPLAVGAFAFVVAAAPSTARAQDHASAPACAKGCKLSHAHHRANSVGTLGYGPPGLHPGFQGFGLGYHRGYGYGGRALGPGAEGGYPFYGGPGYPQPAPPLRRIGGINPFPYYGGPGGATPDGPQYYNGGLVVDSPVLRITGAASETDYGAFSGMLPYPDSTFASFAAAASGETTTITPQPIPSPSPAPPR